MYSKILVPLDGSKRAERILSHVEAMALSFKAELLLLQVVEPQIAYVSSHGYHAEVDVEQLEREGIKKEAQTYLNALEGEFRAKGVQVRKILEEGPVVRGIIDVAEREEVDLIAMASHGRSGLARVFYGSVAAGVLHQVDRPLLLVRSIS